MSLPNSGQSPNQTKFPRHPNNQLEEQQHRRQQQIKQLRHQVQLSPRWDRKLSESTTTTTTTIIGGGVQAKNHSHRLESNHGQFQRATQLTDPAVTTAAVSNNNYKINSTKGLNVTDGTISSSEIAAGVVSLSSSSSTTSCLGTSSLTAPTTLSSQGSSSSSSTNTLTSWSPYSCHTCSCSEFRREECFHCDQSTTSGDNNTNVCDLDGTNSNTDATSISSSCCSNSNNGNKDDSNNNNNDGGINTTITTTNTNNNRTIRSTRTATNSKKTANVTASNPDEITVNLKVPTADTRYNNSSSRNSYRDSGDVVKDGRNGSRNYNCHHCEQGSSCSDSFKSCNSNNHSGSSSSSSSSGTTTTNSSTYNTCSLVDRSIIINNNNSDGAAVGGDNSSNTIVGAFDSGSLRNINNNSSAAGIGGGNNNNNNNNNSSSRRNTTNEGSGEGVSFSDSGSRSSAYSNKYKATCSWFDAVVSCGSSSSSSKDGSSKSKEVNGSAGGGTTNVIEETTSSCLPRATVSGSNNNNDYVSSSSFNKIGCYSGSGVVSITLPPTTTTDTVSGVSGKDSVVTEHKAECCCPSILPPTSTDKSVKKKTTLPKSPTNADYYSKSNSPAKTTCFSDGHKQKATNVITPKTVHKKNQLQQQQQQQQQYQEQQSSCNILAIPRSNVSAGSVAGGWKSIKMGNGTSHGSHVVIDGETLEIGRIKTLIPELRREIRQKESVILRYESELQDKMRELKEKSADVQRLRGEVHKLRSVLQLKVCNEEGRPDILATIHESLPNNKHLTDQRLKRQGVSGESYNNSVGLSTIDLKHYEKDFR